MSITGIRLAGTRTHTLPRLSAGTFPYARLRPVPRSRVKRNSAIIYLRTTLALLFPDSSAFSFPAMP